jgi:hypothetical protein
MDHPRIVKRALTHVVLHLEPTNFERLVKLVTDPEGRLVSGGYQSRKRKWRPRINPAMHTIELDMDCVGFIQRQIINRNGGGWQKKVADIFTGQHPLFSGLPILMRKPPEDRKHRTPAPQAGMADADRPMP